MTSRVLIVSASMGAGHDGAARELRRRLEAQGHEASILDFLPLMPLRLGTFIRWFYGQQLAHAPGTYQWHYERMQTNRFVFWLTWCYSTWAKGRLRRRIRRARPDAVVSTYPLASQALGALRAQGRLPQPTVTFMTDFSVHPTWVNRHIDLHMTVSPATAHDAAQMSGRPAVATGPLVPAELAVALTDLERAAVRSGLGLGRDDVVALVVAGSWGVGNVTATVERLAAGGAVRPLVVCGRNTELVAALAGIEGAVALGWRTDMAQLLRASDVLVENAGGLTCMEAFQAGVPVISHECIPGHGSHNAAMMSTSGVVTWVREPDDLVPTVLALARGPLGTEQARRARTVFAGDPAAVVASLAEGRSLDQALRLAGLEAAPATTLRHLAPSSRRARATRRISTTLVAGTAVFYASTAGVAAATRVGVGVDDGARLHPSEAFIVVRLGVNDLPASSALVARLTELHATVAVDRRVVGLRGAELRSLAASGVTLVNAGTGQMGGVHPARAHRDLVGARQALLAATGAAGSHVFVASRPLSALDLTTAWVSRDTVVRPDVLVASGGVLPVLHGGSVVLIDGRGGDEATLAAELGAVELAATAAGLTPSALIAALGHD